MISCGAAIQISVWPTSSARKPRTEPRIQRDQVGGRENRQAQEGDQQQLARQRRAEDDLEIEQRVAQCRLVDEEGRQQQDARRDSSPQTDPK